MAAAAIAIGLGIGIPLGLGLGAAAIANSSSSNKKEEPKTLNPKGSYSRPVTPVNFRNNINRNFGSTQIIKEEDNWNSYNTYDQRAYMIRNRINNSYGYSQQYNFYNNYNNNYNNNYEQNQNKYNQRGNNNIRHIYQANAQNNYEIPKMNQFQNNVYYQYQTREYNNQNYNHNYIHKQTNNFKIIKRNQYSAGHYNKYQIEHNHEINQNQNYALQNNNNYNFKTNRRIYNIPRPRNIPNNSEISLNNIIWGKLLGKGGFGDVFEIQYNGYKYAGKKIDKKKINNNYMKIAFQRELSILTKMNCCNNSVKFYKHLSNISYEILILELCDGDLKTFIDKNNGGLKDYQIYLIMKELNNAFQILYKENIIHRDIKPENILIKNTNSTLGFIPKLNDYGLSRICKEASTGVIGTKVYTAPEILLRKKYSQKGDLWSIGVMIYYMYFKEFPFDIFYLSNDYSINTMLNRPKQKKCQNQLLDDLINKLLVYNPLYRLSWEEYFQHQFFKSYYY